MKSALNIALICESFHMSVTYYVRTAAVTPETLECVHGYSDNTPT